MRKYKARLDVPGFSFGEKTGEYIDIPRIYGGHGAKRKSGKPHSYQELACRTGTRTVVGRANLARQEYNKGKRLRLKQVKKPKTNPFPAAPCLRRFLEFSGLKPYFLQYVEPPELITPRPRTCYEVTDGILPLVTFTSAREASIMCSTLARYGIAAYFNQIAVYSIKI